MPSVKDNTKYVCKNCGTIADLSSETGGLGDLRPCPNCGLLQWDQLLITKVCDFCATTQNVSWEFPCENFRLPVAIGMPLQGFQGAWAACETCKEFVEREDKRALLARAIKLDPDKAQPIGQYGVRTAHNGFFAHRTGPPVPFQEED